MSITNYELGRRPRAALLALGMLSAFGPISTDFYLPALPRLASDLSVADGAAQLTLSGSLAGLALGQLLVGPLSDRFGRRRPLLLGLAGFVLFSIACAAAPSLELLVAARILQGMCGAAGVVVARAVVRDAYPDSRLAGVFSLLMVINGLSPVVAPLAGGGLLHLVPWRGLFAALALIGAVIAALTAASLPETLPPAARRGGGLRALGRAVADVSSDRLFVGAAAVLACTSGVLFVYISLSSFVLQSDFGLSPGAFSAVFALNSVGIVLGGRVSTALLRRRDAAAVLRLGLLAMTVGSALALLAAVLGWGLPGILPPVFVAIGAVGLVLPNAAALALLRHGSSAGTASALFGATQFLSGAVAGPLASSFGASAVAMTAAMAVAALGATAVAVRVLPRRAHAAPRMADVVPA
ncbi:multidrug effflux MFS transporter [Jatrophihabitans fulvus]